MYEYKFLNIENNKKDYHIERKINKLAKEGWRLIQIIEPNVTNKDDESHFNFVFEREKENDYITLTDEKIREIS